MIIEHSESKFPVDYVNKNIVGDILLESGYNKHNEEKVIKFLTTIVSEAFVKALTKKVIAGIIDFGLARKMM